MPSLLYHAAHLATTRRYAWIYFVTIAFLGGLFVVNLFLCVIFDEFMRSQEADEVAELVDEAAAGVSARAEAKGHQALPSDSVEVDAALLGAVHADVTSDGHAVLAVPPRSKRGWCDCGPAAGTRRALLGEIVTGDRFGHGSTALVLLNVLLMCMPYAGQPPAYTELLETLGNVISVVFMAEMGLKLSGLGCANYWADGWNKLDGTIVILSAFDMGLTILLSGGGVDTAWSKCLPRQHGAMVPQVEVPPSAAWCHGPWQHGAMVPQTSSGAHSSSGRAR